MLVRLIIWGIIGFLIYTAYQAIRQALIKPPPEKTTRGEEMVRDPECGTYVPRSDAIKTQIRSKTYYFCSEACRDKYREHS